MFLSRIKRKKLRELKGLRESQIAEYLNYKNEDDYRSRECGSVPISEVDLTVLAKFLGVPAVELTATNN